MKKVMIALACALMLSAVSCSTRGVRTSSLEGSELSMSGTTDSVETSAPADVSTADTASPSAAPSASSTTGKTSGSATASRGTARQTGSVSPVVSRRSDVRISGRIYESSGGPWLSWTGTTIFASIRAGVIQVKLRVIPAQQGADADSGCDYVDVIVDGGTPVVLKLHNGSKDSTPAYTIASGLPDRVHTVEIVKRTESILGPIQFEGFVLPKGGSFAAPPAAPSRKIEFFGSSSVCGYGNEGSGYAFKASEENGYMAFGTITARSLNAEQHTIGVSGAGVVRDFGGSQGKVLLDEFKKVVTQFESSQCTWNFKQWIPDAVVINVADNDFAADSTLNDGVVFRQKFRELLSFIRSRYPKAYIFCTTGLTGAKPIPKMAPFTEQTVRELNDPRIFYVGLHDQMDTNKDGIGANGHPSVKTDIRIADYLTKQIKLKTGW